MIRPYRPGDDVRHIDWNVTARMREPHVRVHVGERAMTAWLLLDVSASMTFGTADRRKADVAEGVALAIGHVATRRGNRLGVVAIGGGEPRIMRPRQGRLGLLALLAELRTEPEADGAGATALGDAARAHGGARAQPRARGRRLRLPRRPRLGGARCARCAGATACSRSRSATRASSSCRRSATSGSPIPRPGRQLSVNTSRRGVRKRFAKAAAAEREEVAAALRRCRRRAPRALHARATGCARWPGTCGARRCGCARRGGRAA